MRRVGIVVVAGGGACRHFTILHRRAAVAFLVHMKAMFAVGNAFDGELEGDTLPAIGDGHLTSFSPKPAAGSY